MTKIQNNIFKIVILLLGLGVIGLAYLFFAGDEPLTKEQKFIWINICVLYAVLFIPSLVTSFGRGKNDASKIISFGMFSTFLSVVEIVLITMTILVPVRHFDIRIAVIIEAVVIFGGVIGLYVSMLTSSHIQAVDQQYDSKLSQVKAIRSQMEMLNVKAGTLNEQFGFEKKKISSISEGFRFLAPNDSPMAVSQEEKIITKISEIDYAIDVVLGGGDAAQLKQNIAMLENLLNQRKLVRS